MSLLPASRIHFLQYINDVLITLRGLWLLLLFNALAVFAFLGAPQGTDVLLSITEDAAQGVQYSPLFWLLVALLFWSIASEFCTRLIVYLTDNSGRSLAPGRVYFRKAVQRFLSRFFLYFPSVLMALAFLKAWLVNFEDVSNGQKGKMNDHLAFIIILIVLIALVLTLHRLYAGGIKWLAQRKHAFKWMYLSPHEVEWVNKLYGILSDVRVDIPSHIAPAPQPDLPRRVPLANGMVLPYEFKAYSNNPVIDGNLHVYMFRIPFSFYQYLRKQMFVLSFIAAILILVFALLPAEGYMFFGAASLICLAFACWQVIFVLIYLVEKVQKVFPLRLTLLVLFIISSFYNQDHPARTNGISDTGQQPLVQHFNQWYAALEKDTLTRNPREKVYRVGNNKDSIPIVFIAAEGGALRTGAFTSMILSKLADSFPSFPRYIYCYSGVSGGTLGTNFFNALYLDRRQHEGNNSYAAATEAFYGMDFLAAATGKLVFGEIINYFIPWHIPAFDRAIALEKAWEKGYHTSVASDALASSFNNVKGERNAALFINTTEAESGLQCIWSNVGLDTLTLGRQRDLNRRTRLDMNYSTAINLSTRFPLVSPGATLFYEGARGTERKHFVDGGYFENTGAETLLEVMKLLPLQQRPVKPYVIQFNFADEDSTIKSTSIRKFSEIMEIIGAIYNTRSGRSNLSQAYLKNYVDSLGGVFIPLRLSLNTRKFPMSWTLSQTAMHRLNRTITDMINPRARDTSFLADKRSLQRLFVYDR